MRRSGKIALQLVTACLLAGMRPALGHDIITTKLTYSRDISRIFSRRCISCHGEGSPVALTSYEEVRPWAVDIKEQVLNRSMPPWGAVKGFGNFAPDRGLTQEELLIIASWVVGGAPEGDPSMLPKKPLSTAHAGSQLVDALTVTNSARLTKPLIVFGIEPRTTSRITSAKITARLPDGRVEPLVWLYQYDPKYAHAFVFRDPIKLPSGTKIEATAPLSYELKTGAQSALAGIVNTVVSTTP